MYSKLSGQIFDGTHKHFLTKWSFGNRENCANFLYKKCFFLFFYSFYVKISQNLKVTYTIQNPPGRVFFFWAAPCSMNPSEHRRSVCMFTGKWLFTHIIAHFPCLYHIRIPNRISSNNHGTTHNFLFVSSNGSYSLRYNK